MYFSYRCYSSIEVQLLALWLSFSASVYSECLNFDHHQIHLSTLALLFHNCTCFVQLESELYSLAQLFCNSYFARCLMFTHDAIVFKSQPRVRPRSLSEDCQNQIFVNKKRLARLSDVPCQFSFPRQRSILPCSSGTYSRQPGVNKMARMSTRSSPPETKTSLYGQGNL